MCNGVLSACVSVYHVYASLEEKRERHTCYEFRRGWRQEARNHYLEPKGGSGRVGGEVVRWAGGASKAEREARVLIEVTPQPV